MHDSSGPERVNWNSITERELFNIQDDPFERINLYEDLRYRPICINFEKTLFKIIKDSAKINGSQKKTKIDKETIEHLKSLGYLR